MKNSKDLLKEIQAELSQSKGRVSPPSKEKDFHESLQNSHSQNFRRSVSPFEKSELSKNTKSEILAEKLLEKVKRERERIASECESLRTQISQILSK